MTPFRLAALGAVLVAGLSAAGGLSRAADDPVVEGSDPAEMREEQMVVGRLRLHAAPGPRQAAEYDLGRMFDQQVFGRPGGVAGGVMVVRNGVAMPVVERPVIGLEASLAAVRRRGERRIELLEKVCGLEAAQVAQLQMALASDLKRLSHEITGLRATYAGTTMQAAAEHIDRELLTRLRSDAEACRRQIDQLPGSGSLLVASLPHVLGPAQASAFADWLAARRRCRWRAIVAAVLVQLDDNGLGLAASQHDALEELLLGQVPPLDVLREGTAGNADAVLARFQAALVLARLAAREPAWQPLLDPRQQEFLRQRIGQAGGGDPAAVERLLVQQGVLEEVGP
jgi:hypothetical protein